MCDLLDDNNFFIFDDESVRISPVSKMPFRKKPCDSMIVRSKSNLNKSLPRTVHKWLPKLQPLAEPIVQTCLWIIDSGCAKHMTGNRALLTNLVEKFLGTVRFGNNDFAVIADYGDVVIGSMTIKKVYYVEGLGHNLFSVGKFYDKGLEWAYLSTHPSKRLTSFCYDDDDDDEEEDYISAITPNEPVLSTKEPDKSLSMGDEHLDTIPATESDEVIKSSVEDFIPIPSESEGIPEHMCDVFSHDNSPPLDVLKDQIEDFFDSNDEFSSTDDDSFSIDKIDYVEASPPDSELVSLEVMEIVIPEVGEIDDDILLTIKDDILREKLLNVNLLIAKIEALNANPTPSSDFRAKSPSTSLNSLLEETNTSDNSLPEFETFCFDVEEISSGITTTYSDISLPEYEVFHDDHVKEISSGSPTTHSDSSLYASFIFDLSINPFPPADRSDFYEFTDDLIPFISPSEYDCFLFKVEPNSRDFTKDVVEDISLTKEPQVHNALPTHPTLQLNMNFQHSSEYLFTYVVWIFFPFLVYSVTPS
nr:integrase, catalytic region, zinc finger, CCHC-type, peptidase aspartic, catalytic [Tanacetum cinerariifolium]